jgi:molybdate transport system substrate-binding protein
VRIRAALLLAAVLVLAAPAAAQAFTVFGAASLSSAFPQIDSSPRYNFAGSNQLQLQIERGAPADLFASASPAEPRALFREGKCSRPITFATNVLVLVTPRNNPAGLRSVYGLRTGRHRIAVGTAGVPIGAYTRQLLRRMQLTSILNTNTVSLEPNVNSIVAKVGLGSADAGFAYFSDWKAAAARLNRINLPKWAQPPVRYQMCVVRRPGADTASANRFIQRVLASRGRAILKRFGFGITPRG